MKTVAGLDVHKGSVYLCILQENGEKIERVYGVLTPQLDSMRDFMAENEVSEVAMESTSVYWIPIWRVLVDSFELKLWLILTLLSNFLGVRVMSRMLNGLQNAS